MIHEFDVPDLAAVPRLDARCSATPCSPSRRTRRGAAAGGDRAALVRGRIDPVREFEVYGAGKDKPTGMPRVINGYTIRRKADSTVVMTVDPTRITPTSLGKLSRIVGVAARGYAPRATTRWC